MFCNELDSCQKTLETQTSESRKVLYLLNSAQREISKGEQELKELQSINVNNKTELKQKFDRIKVHNESEESNESVLNICNTVYCRVL